MFYRMEVPSGSGNCHPEASQSSSPKDIDIHAGSSRRANSQRRINTRRPPPRAAYDFRRAETRADASLTGFEVGHEQAKEVILETGETVRVRAGENSQGVVQLAGQS